MNRSYIAYDLTTGEIEGVYFGPEEYASLDVDLNTYGLVWDMSADDSSQYVVNGGVVDKPEGSAVLTKSAIIADGVDVTTISSLPVPSTVSVNGNPYTTTDGSFEFTTDIPGVYNIVVESFPYLPQEFVINAS